VTATNEIDPRIERTRSKVLAATIEVVGERGFSAASIEAIADQSGVARSTIYRHWPNRTGLLLEAVRDLLAQAVHVTLADLRSDLISILTALSASLTTEPIGTIVASLVFEARHDPEIAELRRQFVKQRFGLATEVITSAIARGELPESTDASAMVTDLGAPIFFRGLALGEPSDPAWIESLVDRWIDTYRDDRTPHIAI
jgi:AcrR family transcriptional regulator